MREHELAGFLRTTERELADEYTRIRNRVAEDPGTAGDEGEENWAGVLRRWLPSQYRVVTKGRLLGADGTAGPQVDVLVLKPSYPPVLAEKKLYLADGVAAAFECKLTLRPKHIADAFARAVRHRARVTPGVGTARDEMTSPLIFGLLAHSSECSGFRLGEDARIRNLIEEQHANAQHPRDLVDLITVANLGTWAADRDAATPFPDDDGDQDPPATTYLGLVPWTTSPATRPVALFLTSLLIELAWRDAGLRSVATYFVGTVGGTRSGTPRLWKRSDVFSRDVRGRIAYVPLTPDTRWDPWR